MSTANEKIICISGTSRGIGEALAKRFLALGYMVIGISRSPSSITHPHFRELHVDLSRPESVCALRSQLVGERIVGLINNAGIHGPIGPFADNDLARWIEAFQVNLFSAGALGQICIPSLRRERGFIIFLSGGGSAFPRPNFSAYAVSKTAVVRLAETLACELAPEILVYTVAPGPNKTALLDEAIAAGTPVLPEDLVDFSCPVSLCEFLAQNTDQRYSGKFIHAKDRYAEWGDAQLAPDAHTLRRVKG